MTIQARRVFFSVSLLAWTGTLAADKQSTTTKIQLLDDKIKEQQHLAELEEGGGNSRFRTEFAAIGKLYDRRDALNTRLQALLRSQI